MSAPRVALSIGCPCGIGPEVSVVAAARATNARVLLVGDANVLYEAARLRGVDASRLDVYQPGPPLAARDRAPGAPTRASGAAQLAWIDAACALVVRGEADALVTGPVSKDAIASSGAPGSRGFMGHTEHLALLLKRSEVTMAFHSKELTTALVTTHVPLARVPQAVTAAGVARAACALAEFLSRLGVRAPRLVVAGVNPHAGESGRIGREEIRAVAPGVAKARTRVARLGASVEGPMGAESAFRLAAGGRFDGVVAMYHDQATIPMKLLGFGEAVNVTLGLPIVRTSVDHGTAYDRAGKGTADASGMRAAIDLAVRLTSARRRPTRATPSRASRSRRPSA
jgi:4-hydroxythreonine-4-phosphate dehydrogenase